MARMRCAISKVPLQDVVVANIDFLCQKERLKKLAGFGKSEVSDREETKTLMWETFGVIKEFREALRLITDRERRPNLDLEQLPEQAKPRVAEAFQSCSVSQNFSDTLVYHISLTEGPVAFTAGVWKLLCIIGAAVPAAFALSTPLRGGVALHWAVNIAENEIYGPAPFYAYYLESEVADYPRVVIHQKLVDYLHSPDVQDCDGMDAEIARFFARQSLKLIGQDDDGLSILDYLGDGCRLALNAEAYPKALDKLLKATRFVDESLLKSTTEGDAKMASRYGRLKAYFDRSMPRWQQVRDLR